MSNGHDTRYKWVFSHHTFVEKFFRSFVPLPFVKKLDFSTLERIDKEFISEEFRLCESDLVYRIKFLDRYIYIYLLIEFQSTVDKTMPMRMNHYTGQLYQFIKPDPVSGLYPAAFPVLLYNGDAEWNVPDNVADLIEPSIPRKFIPDFHYFPVLINKFSKKTLVKIRNVVSAIFYIENSSPEELEKNIDELVSIINNEENESLQTLTNWFINYLKSLHEKGTRIDNQTLINKITSPMEVRQMFATKLKEHDEKLLKKGEQLGIKKGEQLGIKKRAIETARRMLEKKYSINDISEVTGLTHEEIEQLR